MKVKITFLLRAESLGGGDEPMAQGRLFEMPVYSVTRNLPSAMFRVYMSRMRGTLRGFIKIMETLNNSWRD